MEEDLSDEGLTTDHANISHWHEGALKAAITNLAQMHGLWLNRYDALNQHIHLGQPISNTHIHDAKTFFELTYQCCANHLGELFSKDLLELYRHLLDTLDIWWTRLDQLPKTLVYGDTVARNIALRTTQPIRIALFDWEVASYRPPQEDIVELLCYTMSDKISDQRLLELMALARTELEKTAQVSLNQDQWHKGLKWALANLLIARLSLQISTHRLAPRPDAQRVCQSFMRLYRLLDD